MGTERRVQRVHRRRRPAEIAQLVAEFESSGLSRSAFCREKGMNGMTLQVYERRQRRMGRETASGAHARNQRARRALLPPPKQWDVAPEKGSPVRESAVSSAEVGRRRYRTRAEADQLAAEYEASGLRREEFCVQKNVPIKTLARYIAQRLRVQKSERERPRWVAVEVPRSRPGGAEIVISLAGGRRLEVHPGFDADTLRKLVSVLERV